jgi:hypothetical protein
MNPGEDMGRGQGQGLLSVLLLHTCTDWPLSLCGLTPFSHFLLSLPCETAFRAQGRSQAEFRNEEPKRVSF